MDIEREDYQLGRERYTEFRRQISDTLETWIVHSVRTEGDYTIVWQYVEAGVEESAERFEWYCIGDEYRDHDDGVSAAESLAEHARRGRF